MSKFWGSLVKGLEPYVPGEQPKQSFKLKLNTNENPFGPSPKVLEAIQNQLNQDLRLYPDPESDELRLELASYFNVERDMVFVGNGSDEILAFIFQAFFQDQKLLFPDITYSFYPVYSSLFSVDYQLIPLNDYYEIDLMDYEDKNSHVIFPNPNAPTGMPLSLSKIENFVKKNPHRLIVVDEAYVDFGTESSIKLINKYDNIIITQSFSKSRSLAGLRIGCAFANSKLIEGLLRVKNSFNSYPIDRLAQTAAMHAIKDQEYFEKTRQSIIRAREYLINELDDLNFKTLKSGANFIFTSHSQKNALDLFQQLRKESVLVRHFKNPSRISNYLRITIGTDEQMKDLVSIIKKLI